MKPYNLPHFLIRDQCKSLVDKYAIYIKILVIIAITSTTKDF